MNTDEEMEYIDSLYFAGKISTSQYNSLAMQVLAACSPKADTMAGTMTKSRVPVSKEVPVTV